MSTTFDSWEVDMSLYLIYCCPNCDNIDRVLNYDEGINLINEWNRVLSTLSNKKLNNCSNCGLTHSNIKILGKEEYRNIILNKVLK